MATTGRSWVLTLTAGILAFNGVTTILYASAIPLPVLGYAGAPFWVLAGAVSLIAAAGVFRRRRWGRVLGIVLLAGAFIAAALRLLADPEIPVVLLVIGQAPTAFAFWALLRRWQGPV